MNKVYDLVVNLGSNCQVAYQLKRHDLRRFSGPLDWLVSEDAANIVKAMQDRFASLFDNYEVVGENEECYLVKDLKYGFLSVHVFHLNQNFNESYCELKQKISRRSEKLFKKASEYENILVVRLGIEDYFMKDFLVSIENIIQKSVDMIFVNYGQETFKIDYGKVAYVQITNPERWEGDDEAWDYVLENIRLK